MLVESPRQHRLLRGFLFLSYRYVKTLIFNDFKPYTPRRQIICLTLQQ